MVKIAITPPFDHGVSINTIDQKLDKYTRMLANAKESYEDNLNHFSDFLFYNDRERTELSISYGYLQILLPIASNFLYL